jgi:hypothetical protein
MQFGALSSCTALNDGSYFASKRSIENYGDFLTLDMVQNFSNLVNANVNVNVNVNVKNKNFSLSL